jgi:DNA-binding transcriptional MerR regulator
MPKSPDAFRTISEVADWLGIQAHVLRFWESKFTQVKPVKRAGGRRYYRPADMLLLGGIKKLLHDDGLTIKGVQKILREDGMSHVSALSPPLDDADMEAELAKTAPEPEAKLIDVPEREPVSVVLPFETQKPAADAPVASAVEGTTEEVSAQEDGPAETEQAPEQEKITVTAEPDPVTPSAPEEETLGAEPDLTGPPMPAAQAPPAPEDKITTEPEKPASEPVQPAPEPQPEFPLAADKKTTAVPDEADAPQSKATPVADDEDTAQTAVEAAPVPVEDKPGKPDPVATEATPEPAPEPALPKARNIGMPDVTPEDEIHAEIATLTRASRTRAVDAETAQQMAPLLTQLTALRDQMAAHRTGA